VRASAAVRGRCTGDLARGGAAAGQPGQPAVPDLGGGRPPPVALDHQAPGGAVSVRFPPGHPMPGPGCWTVRRTSNRVAVGSSYRGLAHDLLIHGPSYSGSLAHNCRTSSKSRPRARNPRDHRRCRVACGIRTCLTISAHHVLDRLRSRWIRIQSSPGASGRGRRLVTESHSPSVAGRARSAQL
jgi:hypothetical protein